MKMLLPVISLNTHMYCFCDVLQKYPL